MAWEALIHQMKTQYFTGKASYSFRRIGRPGSGEGIPSLADRPRMGGPCSD
jgi:hypothetical protein